MRTIRCTLLFLTLFALLAAAPAPAQDALSVQGIAVTGPNSLLGQQLFDFGLGVGPGTDLVAAYNPGGDFGLPLTPDTPLDTLLVTAPTSNEAEIANVPLRDVPANISTDGETRAVLPGQLEAGTFDHNQAAPSGDVDLGEWLEAEGSALFQCAEGETPRAELRVRDLIPNRVYTVWAIFQGASGAVPFGGAPNVVMTDEHGDGSMSRLLNFCPLEPTAGGAELLYLVVVLHTDQQNYATQPTLPDAGFPPGYVAHPQLQLTLQGTRLVE